MEMVSVFIAENPTENTMSRNNVAHLGEVIMKTRPWFIYVFVVVLLASCTISPTIAQPLDSRRKARRILDSCDVRGGLIVHIGCGEGKLTAALRASDCYIVQGLDNDADNVEEARNASRPDSSTAETSLISAIS